MARWEESCTELGRNLQVTYKNLGGTTEMIMEWILEEIWKKHTEGSWIKLERYLERIEKKSQIQI